MKLRTLETELKNIRPAEAVTATFRLDKPTKLETVVTQNSELKVSGIWIQERKQDEKPEIGLPGTDLRIVFRSVSLATIERCKVAAVVWQPE